MAFLRQGTPYDATLGCEAALDCENSDEGQLTLAWDPVSEASGYELWHYLASGSYYSDNTEDMGDNVWDVGDQTGCTVRVCLGTTYYFSVRAYADYDYFRVRSDFSNEVDHTLDDGLAPTVIDTMPMDGEVGLARESPVAATFSESMDSSTIDGTNFVLEDSFGDRVAAVVGYSEITKTATVTPVVALAPDQTYTARILCAAPCPTDVVGNYLTFDESWSFTTGTWSTIWSDSHVPLYPSYADSRPAELGVRFMSEVDGFVTGIRFYKGWGNTGTHVANLWNIDGELLASAPFVNETETGWQQIEFTTPVQISANTLYVASYHAPMGHYAADVSYFAGAGVNKWPLSAPQDEVIDGNGVFVYDESSSFPANTHTSNNYWVDVVFDTEASGGSSTRTRVRSDPAH